MPRTMVAAASKSASAAGARVADLGGNAVDASIAAVLVSMSTELGIVSPGAGGFLTIWPPDDQPVVVDAYAEMPGRGADPTRSIDSQKVSMDYGGGMDTIVGWGSVAVPGALKGFETASSRFGALPWAELIGPTVDLLRNGFPVSIASGYYLGYAHDAIYGWDVETSPMYHRNDGSPVVAGDVLTNPTLARCYEDIARHGADLLYHGDLGAALVEASDSRGGLITQRDLSEYEAVIRVPSRIELHGWDVATNAPPAVGGMTLAALLSLLEQLQIGGWSADEVARHAAAQNAVFSFRRSELDGDRDRFDGGSRLFELARRGDLAGMHQSPSTVHASAVDDTGLACSVTVSAGYGAGVVIPGTGFGLNNSLGEIELISEGLHALPAGRRLLSNMAPTIGRSRDGEVMAIGSPGADRITTAIASVLMNYIVCGMDIETAVAYPRIHAEVFENVPSLAVEPGIDSSAVKDLVIRELPANSMYFGGVQAAMVDAEGVFMGASDPRRAGAVVIGGSDG
ncbi:MAG: gamma-glutamyltransferase [Acidimicrobiia bacterium]